MEQASKEANAPTEPSITPQSLIKEEHVKKVLLEDKGKQATLISWKVVDFTSKGDNYASVVTSVEVNYAKDKKEYHVVYVVKLNPCRHFLGLEETTNACFSKEAKFYLELLPQINAVLEAAGKERMRMARCFLGHLAKGEEQIYFEDLRSRGFKMFDRKKGMDIDHTLLVLRELGRLHAASHILQSKTPEEPLEEKYDFLKRDFLTSAENSKEMMLPILQGNLKTSIEMLKKTGGYERAIAWIETLHPRLEELLTTGMNSKTMNCVNHGDCWNNNILFRYNNEGKPVDVILLDLQICRKASLAIDLNYFLYTSLSGAVRKPNLSHFLSTYYSSYKDILATNGFKMHFTKEELMEEFRYKNTVGALFGMMVIPIVLVESDKAPDLSGPECDFDKALDTFATMGLAMMDTNPLLKPRFLAMFDELMENGTIP